MGDCNNKFMQKHLYLFCPWDDDREKELAGISPPQSHNSPPRKYQHFNPTNKKIGQESPVQIIQEQAKTTLLHIAEHQKSNKMQILKDYVDRKKQDKRRKENELPSSPHQLKLPPLNPLGHRKHIPNLKHSSKRLLEEAMSQLDNSADNEEHIFRKYGEHKKGQKGSSVERSFSLGHQPFQLQHELSQPRKKYQTIDSPTAREKRGADFQLGELQLKGKKYSCGSRESRSRGLELLSYVPTQPNITPHYVLFGHNKEDILKKVLQQLQHKFKEVN